MKTKNKIIKIFWLDAIIYNYKFFHKGLTIPKKITIGEFIKKENNYFFIKNPISQIYSHKEKKYIGCGDSSQTFFAIPKGMIKKIEEIKNENQNPTS